MLIHSPWELCGLHIQLFVLYISRVSCQKHPTRHAYACQIEPFWLDNLDIYPIRTSSSKVIVKCKGMYVIW